MTPLHTEPKQPGPLLARSPSPETIMVVDDTPANLDILTVLLESEGFRVLQFPRGNMALRAAQQHPPNMILLDIMMPEMDGFEVCQAFKADVALREIPAIFISALNDTANKVKAFTQGGVDYITKPFQREEVLARVKTHLKMHRLQQELKQHQRHLEKAHQEQLEFISQHDVLTGLLNRDQFTRLLNTEMTACRRRHEYLAVIYIDMDNFAAVNARYGHKTGDHLLAGLARRLEALDAGGAQSHWARIGGDEFAVIAGGMKRRKECKPAAQKLLEAIARPFDIDGVPIRVTASIGMACFPQALDAEQLLRQADQAMYQAKLAGKNRSHIFDADVDEHTRLRYEQIEDLRRALHQQEFVLYYQPKVNMHSGAVIGFEALIRWQHPQRGLLPPGLFIPMIEQHPLSIQLGDWVMVAALRQLAQWKSEGLNTVVSVNVDSLQLHDSHFAERLKQQLQKQPQVAPCQLELEILETGAMSDMAAVSALILELRDLGITFALDDFGTGYSSLTFLKQLAAHTVKIDQSFVRAMLSDVDQAIIIDSILGLTRRFGRQALAEGVETDLHGELLLEMGCEIAQGYAIARPMPAADVPRWMAAWQAPLTWRQTLPLAPEDLPALFAELSLRAVTHDLIAWMDGLKTAEPQLTAHRNRMQQWLRSRNARQRYGERLELNAVISLNETFLDSADQLVTWYRSGRRANTAAFRPELEARSQDLLNRLKSLRDGSQSRPAAYDILRKVII